MRTKAPATGATEVERVRVSRADELMSQPVTKPNLLRRRPEIILSPLLLVCILLVWHFAVVWFNISHFLLPAPRDVFEALWRNIEANRYTEHLLYTMRNSIAGFAAGSLLGVLVAAVLAASPLSQRVFHPYIVALQTFPKVALIPMLTIWFGFDAQPKIIIAAILAFFPVMVNALAGLTALDVESEELMRSFQASALQTFLKLRLPTALPYIFAGLELALVFAILGAVTGEFLGSSQGLGFLIQQFSTQLRTQDVFSLLVIFAVIGVSAHLLIRWVHKRVIYWQ